MVEKRFLLPWQKKHVIVCPECGGRIWTGPLWYWQKQPDKLGELQLQFCHSIDSELLEKIPVLTENDWKSAQSWNSLIGDIRDGFGLTKTSEGQNALTMKNDLPEIFSKHGIFVLIAFLTETELQTLFLFLSLEPGNFLVQAGVQVAMEISRSYVSAILKKLLKWRLIQAWKTKVQGRARGRQLAYTLADETRKILDQDLQNHDFFREALIQTARPIAEKFPTLAWRKDLVKPSE